LHLRVRLLAFREGAELIREIFRCADIVEKCISGAEKGFRYGSLWRVFRWLRGDVGKADSKDFFACGFNICE